MFKNNPLNQILEGLVLMLSDELYLLHPKKSGKNGGFKPPSDLEMPKSCTTKQPQQNQEKTHFALRQGRLRVDPHPPPKKNEPFTRTAVFVVGLFGGFHASS